MSKKATPQGRYVCTRLSLEEYATFRRQVQQSNYPSAAAYARRLLLQKPVTLRYRNASLDDALEELVLLRHHLETLLERPQEPALAAAIQRLQTLIETLTPLWLPS